MSSGEQLVNNEAPRQPTPFEDMSVTDQMMEMEHRRVVQRQRKGAVTRFIGNVEQAIIECDRAKVQVNLDKSKQSFVVFETYNDNYHELLDTEALFDESQQWFMNVEHSCIKGVKAAFDFLSDSACVVTDTDRPPPPLPMWTQMWILPRVILTLASCYHCCIYRVLHRYICGRPSWLSYIYFSIWWDNQYKDWQFTD